MIDPVILKGFRDSLPKDEIPKKKIMRKLEDVFSSYGFVPIDTPVLEYTEVLLGKGGGETDKQIFRFSDNGGRDVAMRFDLTVPFARFMAAHHDEVVSLYAVHGVGRAGHVQYRNVVFVAYGVFDYFLVGRAIVSGKFVDDEKAFLSEHVSLP